MQCFDLFSVLDFLLTHDVRLLWTETHSVGVVVLLRVTFQASDELPQLLLHDVVLTFERLKLYKYVREVLDVFNV